MGFEPAPPEAKLPRRRDAGPQTIASPQVAMGTAARHLTAVILAAGLQLCGVPAAFAQPQSAAAAIAAQCWSDPWPKPWLHGVGRNFGTEPVKLTLRNPSEAYLEICVYDSVCGHLIYSGSLHPKAFVRLLACADQRHRGSILVLDRAGNTVPFRNLRSGTIKLPVERR